MAAKFGTTPWGEYFLEALNGFYQDDARIKRGKRYAANGRVFSLKIGRKKITAKVKGNYMPYYNVTLRFEPFSDEIRQKIYDIIDNNPLILASIVNGELPFELMSMLKKEGIELFPKAYRELSTKCGCPDWGDPCKHIAGVYYVLTSMIDNDPFILFKIRGVDLINHYKIKKEMDIAYPFRLDFKKSSDFQNKPIEIIKLNNYKEFVLSKLGKNPPFMQIDFYKLLERFYKFSEKLYPLHLSRIENENIELIERVFKSARFNFYVTEEFAGSFVEISHPLLTKANIKKLFNKESDSLLVSPVNLVRYFLSFKDGNGNEYYNYFYFLSRFAYLLVQSNGFVFDVLRLDEFYYGIAKPLISPVDIQKQLKLLSEITPQTAIFKDKYLDGNSTNIVILSAILTDYVKMLNFTMKTGSSNRINKSVFDLLFGVEPQKANFELEGIYKGVDKYFMLFDILSLDVELTLLINEKSEKYTMEMLSNGKNINKIKDKNEKLQIFRLISKFTDTLPKIESLVKNKSVELDFEELEDFILKQKDIIQNLGIKVIIPKELQKLLRPQLKIRASTKAANPNSFFSLDKLLEYDFFVAIGDEKISMEELNELLKNGRKVVKFKDKFVYLEPNEIEQLLKQAQKQKKLNKYDLIHHKLNDEIELDENLNRLFEQIFTLKKYPLPPVNANLREYQKRGILWGINNLINGFGVIFADDMGLGKTLQAIAIIAHMKTEKLLKKPALVVVPATILNNWAKEVEKFAPFLSYSLFYGQDRTLSKESDIIFTSYQTLRRDIEIINNNKFDMIIIDEAQNIKNPLTQVSKSVKSIKAKYKIALSGTPVENNLSELWSIFDFALPKYLKTLQEFNEKYVNKIQIQRNKETAKRLQNITSPFMIRRLKTDKNIIKDLPEKIVIDRFVTMEKQQAALYKSFVDENLKKLDSIEKSNRSGLIFKLLIGLKQICNHPRNFDKSYGSDYRLSGKTLSLMQLLETILERDEKVLIFTQYTQMGDILENIIKDNLLVEPLYLKGSMSKKKKDEAIEKFDTDKESKIFILSLKAGGVGLNLTAANNVIHYDLWFNPAVENQATDRAFRIGQTKNVNVFRFITQNSFEEKIDKMIKAKMELQELTVATGENWIGNLSDEELRVVFE